MVCHKMLFDGILIFAVPVVADRRLAGVKSGKRVMHRDFVRTQRIPLPEC